MCRERAAIAKREMEYWLAEADEWKQLNKTIAPSPEEVPVQLDWCAEPNSIDPIRAARR